MKKQITTDDAPKAPAILSQGIVSDNLVFVAGQIHTRADDSMVEGSVEEKVAQIFRNIEAILKAADCDLNSIVKVVVYVTDMSLMPELNKVYPPYFSEPLPVREAVCVKELPLGASIEISVIAAK